VIEEAYVRMTCGSARHEHTYRRSLGAVGGDAD
jgi:hypothetical protein